MEASFFFLILQLKSIEPKRNFERTLYWRQFYFISRYKSFLALPIRYRLNETGICEIQY